MILSPAMNPTPPPSSGELRAEIWRLRSFYLRALMFAGVASLLSLMPSVYMLEVYGRVVNSSNATTLLMLTILVVFAYAVMEVLEWVRLMILRQAGRILDNRLSARVLNSVFAMSLQRGGQSAQQALGDLRTLTDFFVSPALLAALEIPLALLVVVLMFWIHPLLGWFAVSGAIFQIILAVLTERRTQPPLAQANREASAAQQYAENGLRNAEVIGAMGMLDGVEHRWLRYQNRFLRQQAVASDHAGGLAAIAKNVQLVFVSALLGLGCWLVLVGQLDGASALWMIGSILGGKMMQPLVQIISQWRSVIEARGAYRRLSDLLARLPPEAERMSLPPPQGQLSVEMLTAGAPGSPVAILRNVSFALQPGECLAVVGPSASGKTTLARLLMGLWPALSGKVRLDGADVFTWNKTELGPHVGYLPQGIELFDGTLAENIARFGEPDLAAVEAAARLVGLDELVAEWPDGYQTRIGEEGALLSGGQRQRVGLARAFYRTPRFVVLDEPNSSLDEAGEKHLLQTLMQLKARGVTVVVMTHRTSVLAAADRMLVLVGGIVQAFGPRDEVLAALAAARQGKPAAQPLPSPPAGASLASTTA